MASQLALVGPDHRQTQEDLAEISGRFIAPFGKLLAIDANDPARVIAALLSPELRQADLILVRDWAPLDEDALTNLGVAEVMDENGEVRTVSDRTAAATGGIWLQTSGTTGPPKLVRHDRERLQGRIRQPVTEGPARWMLTYHPGSFAGLQVLLTAFPSGEPIVYADRAKLASLGDFPADELPTCISATPTYWRAMLSALGTTVQQFPIEIATLGGEIADQPVLDLLAATFPTAKITHVYAATELGVILSVSDRLAGFPESWLDAEREIKVTVRDGMLFVQSPYAAGQTVRAGSSVDAEFAGNWTGTGDLVEIRDGRVFFMGREDSVINVGGQKVFAEDIEQILQRHPAVRDIRIYAVPNPILGTAVAADVVLDGDDLAGLKTFARENLSRLQIPVRWNVLDTLEMNAAGKKTRKPTP